MKTIHLAAALAALLATPIAMAASDAPAQVKLTQALTIPVTASGQTGGWMVLPSGAPVVVEASQGPQLLVDFAGARAWVPRADTDFYQRQTAVSSTQQNQTAAAQAAQDDRVAAYEAQEQQATADLQAQLQGYVSPLERGPYDQNRSVVDNYDWLGRRYNIGVFGQRIYE